MLQSLSLRSEKRKREEKYGQRQSRKGGEKKETQGGINTAKTESGSDPDGMAAWLKALAYGAGGIAVVGLAALVALQEKLVYVPVLPGLARAYAVTPARFRLTYEDVWLSSCDGVRLHSWFIKYSPNHSGNVMRWFLLCNCEGFGCLVWGSERLAGVLGYMLTVERCR